jgi:hypothetical protein
MGTPPRPIASAAEIILLSDVDRVLFENGSHADDQG